jgi:hypothetical protein
MSPELPIGSLMLETFDEFRTAVSGKTIPKTNHQSSRLLINYSDLFFISQDFGITGN